MLIFGVILLVSVVQIKDAVTCAVAIQTVRERKPTVSTSSDVFHIGINVGDVIIEGNDILGDGVDIAARIEGLVNPGGISISEDVWRQVQGKVAANFVDAGEQSLKNIARAARVYRVEIDDASRTQPTASVSNPA